jgi:glycosyltransferase involved in cell wall biosynthesis
MISIIIPTLNEEKVLEKTLVSLVNSKEDLYEIIVSDGKSTDRTIEIARKYADKVVVYEGEKRQTIGMGRNLGASVASGDYLVFLDADVFVPQPELFFKQAISCFEKDENLVAVIPRLKVFPEIATIADRVIFNIVNFNFFFINNIFHRGGAGGEFQMIKTDVFKRLGGYNESLSVAEDQEIFWRLSGVGRTKLEWSLSVFHTSRRAHKVGWPKLLWSWLINLTSLFFLKKSYHDEWKEVR